MDSIIIVIIIIIIIIIIMMFILHQLLKCTVKKHSRKNSKFRILIFHHFFCHIAA